MATVLHLKLSHGKNLHRIQKVQMVQYDDQKVLSDHAHMHTHVHDHVHQEVHKQVHIQSMGQDMDGVLNAHNHVHTLDLGRKKLSVAF